MIIFSGACARTHIYMSMDMDAWTRVFMLVEVRAQL